MSDYIEPTNYELGASLEETLAGHHPYKRLRNFWLIFGQTLDRYPGSSPELKKCIRIIVPTFTVV